MRQIPIFRTWLMLCIFLFFWLIRQQVCHARTRRRQASKVRARKGKHITNWRPIVSRTSNPLQSCLGLSCRRVLTLLSLSSHLVTHSWIYELIACWKFPVFDWFRFDLWRGHHPCVTVPPVRMRNILLVRQEAVCALYLGTVPQLMDCLRPKKKTQKYKWDACKQA